MQLERILKLIDRKVQDASYKESDFLDFINLGLGELASTEVFPKLSQNAVISFAAETYQADLPEDLETGPVRAYNLTRKKPVQVYDYLTVFLERFKNLDQFGDVNSVCRDGNILLGQHKPRTEEEVRIWYKLAIPEVMTKYNDDDLFYIPFILRGPLLINYACMQAFSEIEDGAEGRSAAMPNFEKYSQLYLEARANLRRYLGTPDGNPEFVPDRLTHGDITDEI